MRSCLRKIFFIFILAPQFCFCENGDTLDHNKLKSSTIFFNVNQFEYSDSINSIENSLSGFQNYLCKNYLGNTGLAFNDLSFPIISSDVGFRYSKNNFGHYFYLKTNLQFFDSRSPYTDLFYIIGSKKEQDFKGTFSYNVKKNWNVTASFFRIRAEGFYLRQNTNDNFISISSNYKSLNNRFKLLVGLMYNYVQVSENGGVVDDSLFENSENLDKKLLEVNLSSAKGSVLNRSVFINHYVNFGEKANDSTSSIISRSYLVFATTFEDNLLKYEDEDPLAGYYSNIFYDSLRTFDSTYHFKFENEIFFKKPDIQAAQGLKDKIGIGGSIKHQFVGIKQREIDTTFNNIILGANVYNLYSDQGFKFMVSGKYVVSGFNNNDYTFEGSVRKNVIDNLSYMNLDASSKLEMPDFIYQKYYSNHFKWDNDFKQIKENKISVGFSMTKYKFSVGGSYIEYSKPVYFDNYAISRQYSGRIPVIAAFLKKNFIFKNWHLNNNIQYQYVPDSTVIRLPDFVLEHSFYYENDMFKGAMRIQIGAALFYVTEYYANSYMPATTQFYLQNNKKYGNYPFIDFFINARIKTVRIFFKIDHLNSGWSGSKYMETPGYPHNDRAFKLGVSWRFYD